MSEIAVRLVHGVVVLALLFIAEVSGLAPSLTIMDENQRYWIRDGVPSTQPLVVSDSVTLIYKCSVRGAAVSYSISSTGLQQWVWELHGLSLSGVLPSQETQFTLSFYHNKAINGLAAVASAVGTIDFVFEGQKISVPVCVQQVAFAGRNPFLDHSIALASTRTWPADFVAHQQNEDAVLRTAQSQHKQQARQNSTASCPAQCLLSNGTCNPSCCPANCTFPLGGRCLSNGQCVCNNGFGPAETGCKYGIIVPTEVCSTQPFNVTWYIPEDEVFPG